MLQDLANLLRHDLPAQAELVRHPAAGHGLATLKQLVPVAVDLGLVLARDGVRESRRERLRGATVEERHLLAHKFDSDGRDLSGGPGPHAARTQLAHLLRFRKYREIKLCSLFGVVVEPQKRCDLVHGLASISIVSIVEASENGTQLQSNKVANQGRVGQFHDRRPTGSWATVEAQAADVSDLAIAGAKSPSHNQTTSRRAAAVATTRYESSHLPPEDSSAVRRWGRVGRAPSGARSRVRGASARRGASPPSPRGRRAHSRNASRSSPGRVGARLTPLSRRASGFAALLTRSHYVRGVVAGVAWGARRRD